MYPSDALVRTRSVPLDLPEPRLVELLDLGVAEGLDAAPLGLNPSQVVNEVGHPLLAGVGERVRGRLVRGDVSGPHRLGIRRL